MYSHTYIGGRLPGCYIHVAPMGIHRYHGKVPGRFQIMRPFHCPSPALSLNSPPAGVENSPCQHGRGQALESGRVAHTAINVWIVCASVYYSKEASVRDMCVRPCVFLHTCRAGTSLFSLPSKPRDFARARRDRHTLPWTHALTRLDFLVSSRRSEFHHRVDLIITGVAMLGRLLPKPKRGLRGMY